MDVVADLRPNRDNYAALAAMLPQAAGGRLTLPPGRFPVEWRDDRPALRVPGNCVVSAESATLVCSSHNPTLFAMLVIEADDVAVRGLTLVGDKTARPWATPGYWCALAVRHAKNIKLTRVSVSLAQRWGLDVNGADGLTLTRCTLTGNGYAEEYPGNAAQPLIGGLRISAESTRNRNVVIQACRFNGNGGQGANIGQVDNLTVRESQFCHNGLYRGHGNQDGLALNGVSGASIQRNLMRGNEADGLVLTAAPGAGSCHDIDLSANKCWGNGGNGILVYEHDALGGGDPSYLDITNNVCRDNGQMTDAPYPHGFSGIRLAPWGGFGRIHDIRLRANKCFDSRPPGQRTQMCGIDQLPVEVAPWGGLGGNIVLESNRCYNNVWAATNVWEGGAH